ncbi:MAG TPA: hypothetical protein VHX14_14890, partial [Thermoanaerobaculia bacterium]|nr:hypothetical protein [Thermoanaerobaculia bacterium]
GAKLVVEWFQDPVWGISTGGMPQNTSANVNLAAIKVNRVSGEYSGVYKSSALTLLFDKPYRPDPTNRFYADENTGDIVINRTTDLATITKVNQVLFGSSTEDTRSGEITEIRIYAPPSIGGILLQNGTAKNPDGTPQMFWTGPVQRFGLATIKVTAMQFRDPNGDKSAASNIISRHSIRLVVGELPLPIPAGPIQGNANVSFGGNFQVHWGLETSTGDLNTSIARVALPWANAFERPHFEHGYESGTGVDSVSVMSGGSGYTSPPTITIADPPIAPGAVKATATANVTNGILTSVTVTGYGKGYDVQNPPAVILSGGGAGSGASLQANIGSEVWPQTAGQFDNADWFHELLGKDFEDPWYGARSIGDNSTDGTTQSPSNPMCNNYNLLSDDQSTSTPYWAFQWQSVNNYPWQKRIVFPVIKYDYWKRISKQGRGYKGIYYFTYDSATGGFKRFGSGAAKPMSYWANSLATTGSGLGAGLYFFDSVDGSNPQALTGAAKTAKLTPAESWDSKDFNKGFLMEGFVYMNAVSFGTSGTGRAPAYDGNFPGEPFRDIGAPVWDVAAKAWKQCPPLSGIPCRTGAGDGIFTCPDLNNNGKCDIVVMQAPTWASNDPGVVSHVSPYKMSNGNTTFVEKTWKSDAVATKEYGAPCSAPDKTLYDGTNPSLTDCSEPHEPYLNLIYPDVAMDSNNKPAIVTVGWEDPKRQTYRAKLPGVTCSASSTVYDCTSNGYDVDGARVDLNVILYGVLYNEGQYKAEGNAAYYGSVLIQDNIVSGSGTADVWFDEKLIKGSWAPPNMPRVIVFNEQTDEEQQ